MISIKELSQKLNLDESKIVNCYLFGSHIYQTNSIDSDFDFIIIYKNYNNELLEINKLNNVNSDSNHKCDGVWSEDKNYQASLYSIKEFVQGMLDHKIPFLESIYLPEEYKLKELIKFDTMLNIDRDKLFRSISATCSNSWDKCRKILTNKNENIYRGLKSLFHSLRIGKYGSQIAEFGKIIDYINLDDKYTTISLWNEIIQIDNWEDLKLKYTDYATENKNIFKKLLNL